MGAVGVDGEGEGVGGGRGWPEVSTGPLATHSISVWAAVQQKLRRIGRDWGMSGVADTVHDEGDDIHDDEYLISQTQAKKK